MPSYLEFDGKNVDLAVQAACESLNLGKESLRYRILNHGSSGIFGLVGAKKARIRVENPHAADKPSTGATSANDEKPPAAERHKEGEAVAGPGADGGETLFDDQSPETEGKKILEKLLAGISPSADIDTGRKNGRILFHIRGENAALLIGKRGQTLEAIQYLLEKILNRRFETRVKVQVDVEGYLENKKENLRQLAYKMADKAKKSGKPASVGQMNAHDRRIVHIALKGDRQVRTQSVGEGSLRKLLIYPKKNSSNRKRTQRAR